MFAEAFFHCHGVFLNFSCSNHCAASFLNQTITLQDETVVKYQIWDTAGQERFHSLAPMYYRGAQAALVVYDLTDDNSFQKAKSWVKELQTQGDANVFIALVGNKLDKEQFRKVPSHDAKQYAESQHLLFMETSAKTGVNVIDLFTAIAKQLPKSQKPKINPSTSPNNLLEQTNNNQEPPRRGCCG